MYQKQSVLTPQMIFQPTVFWLTAAGLGLLRPGPGTWGSAGALAFWWFFSQRSRLAGAIGNSPRLLSDQLVAV